MSDWEPAACYTEKRVKARVAHRCEECDHPIAPGEVYVRITGVWDHRGETHKLHTDCYELLTYFADPYDGWGFDGSTLRSMAFGVAEALESPMVWRWFKRFRPEALWGITRGEATPPEARGLYFDRWQPPVFPIASTRVDQ